jgi:hypothetical protein
MKMFYDFWFSGRLFPKGLLILLGLLFCGLIVQVIGYTLQKDSVQTIGFFIFTAVIIVCGLITAVLAIFGKK